MLLLRRQGLVDTSDRHELLNCGLCVCWYTARATVNTLLRDNEEQITTRAVCSLPQVSSQDD